MQEIRDKVTCHEKYYCSTTENQRAKFSAFYFNFVFCANCRPQWLRGLRNGSASCWDCGFKSRRGHGCPVCSDSQVLLGRGLWVSPITFPEESYWLWCVWVWSGSLDNETLAHCGLFQHGKDTWATELIFHPQSKNICIITHSQF
jgi:hypothetical protein